jgi:alpha-ribazole phosphatase
MNLWLLRHGESKAQTEEEFSFDSNLSDIGREQSRKAGELLKQVDFDRIYLSPLKRARQTFEETGIPKDKVFWDSRLVEYLPDDGYKAMLPYEYPDYGSADEHNAWNEDFLERINGFLSDLRALNSENILVVGHAGVLSVLVTLFLCGYDQRFGDPYFKYCSMANAAVSLLEFKGSYEANDKLIFWNYQEHLHVDADSFIKKCLDK